MALKFFPETILLLKVDRFEGILNCNKIDRMVNDHLSSYNSYEFLKKSMQISLKTICNFLPRLPAQPPMLWP